MRTLTALLIVAAAAGSARAADPDCDKIPSPTPTPIYITGSTALQPIFNVIGPKIAAQTNNKYTIVYVNTGSCGGSNLLFTGANITTNGSYYPANFDPTGGAKPPTCNAPTGGLPIDLVLSDVDPALCPAVSPRPANIGDFTGPVNDMVLVVPSTSQQQAISAEDVYLMFGMGMAGGVTPWTDQNYYFIRPNTSGTRAMIAANTMLGKHDWLGVSMGANGNFGQSDVFNNVSMQDNNTMTAEKTIGIIGEDFYDTGTARASVHALAFRAFKQQQAYWPDSSFTAKDRKNVRDGHYKIWGYVHMLATVAGGTTADNIVDDKAKYFVKLMTGAIAGENFDAQDAITDARLTPVCAMHVTHDIEGGDQKPFSSDTPCDCSFEARATAATPPGCTACPSGTCSTGVCRKGFCEAK